MKNQYKLGSNGDYGRIKREQELKKTNYEIEEAIKKNEYFYAIDLIDRTSYLRGKGAAQNNMLGRLISAYNQAKKYFLETKDIHSLETLRIKKDLLSEKYSSLNLEDKLI